MLLIASRSVSQGRSSGLLTFAGIAVGTYCHALAAALGLSQLLITMPVAYEVVRWAGCLYLLYLAYRAVRSGGTEFSPRQNMPPLSRRRIFLEGLGTNILNPKMALFVLALFPQFVSPDGENIVVQMLLLATILNSIGFVVNGVVIFSSHIRAHLSGFGRFPRLPQYLLATVFAGPACRLAFGARN
jgi:threonine/homoserine/homoserine lactone efflux protein